MAASQHLIKKAKFMFKVLYSPKLNNKATVKIVFKKSTH